ncbi:hypothetical protein [Pectinatus frisingensis]|nr:hypothetical protein [Pectinatus frisingensis]
MSDKHHGCLFITWHKNVTKPEHFYAMWNDNITKDNLQHCHMAGKC